MDNGLLDPCFETGEIMFTLLLNNYGTKDFFLFYIEITVSKLVMIVWLFKKCVCCFFADIYFGQFYLFQFHWSQLYITFNPLLQVLFQISCGLLIYYRTHFNLLMFKGSNKILLDCLTRQGYFVLMDIFLKLYIHWDCYRYVWVFQGCFVNCF